MYDLIEYIVQTEELPLFEHICYILSGLSRGLLLGSLEHIGLLGFGKHVGLLGFIKDIRGSGLLLLSTLSLRPRLKILQELQRTLRQSL